MIREKTRAIVIVDDNVIRHFKINLITIQGLFSILAFLTYLVRVQIFTNTWLEENRF